MDRRRFLLTSLSAAAAGCAMPAATTAPTASTGRAHFADLRGATDGVEALAPSELSDHADRLRSSLRDRGVDVLVAEPGPTVSWLSEVRWWLSERPFLLVLPVEGEPVWVGPAFEETRARELVGKEEIRCWEEDESPYALVAKVVHEMGRGGGSVAVEPGVRSFVSFGLSEALGTPVVDGTEAVEAVRMRKSRAELALLRRANEVTKRALRAASGELREGMVESDFAPLVRAAQEEAGLEDVWALVLFGPNAAFPHGTGQQRPLQDGDLVLVDTGGSLYGYGSDITRTWAFGEVSAEQRRGWNAVRDAQRAALDRIRPGVRCGDVDAAARDTLTAAGFGPGYRFLTHRLGHGIGLQGHEAPYLRPGNPRPLKPGMTFSVEPGIYIPGELGIRIEDIAAVTDEGVEVFGPLAESLEAPFG